MLLRIPLWQKYHFIFPSSAKKLNLLTSYVFARAKNSKF
ncbi:hypothetical protein HMPREF9176_0892 [Streptococcus downei F0415]|nr:hypothetical protein HMPREF9176_0892 [Streptococcus downei F0415]